ncbi:transcription repressor OFP12-like [Impatiens glandulifera]|uniref:transcription repressor OFP12-like n=1 Tax=Impatiens glandulifera TaxID=253017 RepID=UPI001FB0E453|nr:transcription repressor OFP12-like [Impatiens glandulifera]
MRGIVRRNLNLVNLCFTNFKSSTPIASSTLYQYEEEEEKTNNFPKTLNSSDIEPPLAAIDHSDLATVFSSERFFFSSPGRTSSIMDSSFPFMLPATSSDSPVLDPTGGLDGTVIGGGVAVSTFSEHPYMDFRRSMEEMVVAGNLFDVRSNWEYLHELLLYYLVLNSKPTHHFIVHAFSDLLANLTYTGESRS